MSRLRFKKKDRNENFKFLKMKSCPFVQMHVVPHTEEQGAANQGEFNDKWEQGWCPVLKKFNHQKYLKYFMFNESNISSIAKLKPHIFSSNKESL